MSRFGTIPVKARSARSDSQHVTFSREGSSGPADPARPAQLLLVEDSPADVAMTREALRVGGIPVQLHVAEDGVVAMAFLRRQWPHAGAPRPDLILLDLNLPRMDGREVLAE